MRYSLHLFCTIIPSILGILFGLAFFYVGFTSLWATIVSAPRKINRHTFVSFYSEVVLQFFVFMMMPVDHLKRTWRSNMGKPNYPHVTILPGYTDTDFLFFRLQKHLHRHGIPYTTTRYKPFFGNLEQLSNNVAKQILSTPQKKHILISHSMGGLIAERVSDLLSGSEKNLALIHLATPFNGNQMAALAIRPCGADMLPNSDFIQALTFSEARPRFCIYSQYDNIIAPRRSAISPNTNPSLCVTNWRHNGLLFDPSLLEKIIEKIMVFKQEDRFL